jgi:uncharacterized membrane protein SpoIIM required for sporulation
MLGLKRLFFDRILERSFWVWRRRPVVMVPTMLVTGLSVIERSFATIAVIALTVGLAARGTLTSFAILAIPALSGNVCGLVRDTTFFPLVELVVVVGVIGFILASVIGGGFVYSAEYGTYVNAWNKDAVSIRDVVETGSRHWKPMAWTILLTNLVTWSPLIITLGPLAYLLLSACFVSTLPLEIAVFATQLISIFTLYSYPAVVIDGISGWNAIRHSFRVASHNFGITMTYVVLRGAFQVILFLILVPLGNDLHVPLTALVTVILTLFLLPILHSTKTMIYYYARPDVPEMEFAVSSPIITDLYRRLPRAAWLKVKRGLREIRAYLGDPSNIPYHLASVGALALGIVLGNYVTNNGLFAAFAQLGLLHPGKGNPNVDISKVLPPLLGIDIFFHNWLVSIGTAMAGIGFGLPSFADILLNGYILGLLQPTIPSNVLFFSAILPHGIIEIPSLVLAGSIGIKLGVAAWRVKLMPTPENREALSRDFLQGVYVVVGLALLFLIAGLIEGIVTPEIMKLYGWTF